MKLDVRDGTFFSIRHCSMLNILTYKTDPRTAYILIKQTTELRTYL